MKKASMAIVLLLFVSGCANTTEEAQIANPASVHCENIGGTLEIRTDSDGGQTGYCMKNGKECEEWALYRKECSL